MRWLLCGAWEYPPYEAACASALARLGHDVVPFRWSPFFQGLVGQIERKWTVVGPATLRMNEAMRTAIRESNADVVFVWRGTHVLPRTLTAARSATRALLVSYNNDDPFSPIYAAGPLYRRRAWRLFRRCIPQYDLQLVYRPVNVAEMRQAGARSVELLLPYFVPELDRPIEPTPQERARYECDVIFIGHYEPDGRLEYLRALVDHGVRVRLFGTRWPPNTLAQLGIGPGDVQPIVDDEYRKALCSAKMALCFLSRLNRDVYTRRVFEITACGTLLLSERTNELERMFVDGREAVYFASPDELVKHVQMLLRSPESISAIAAAGQRRVYADGHSVEARMRRLAALVEDRLQS